MVRTSFVILLMLLMAALVHAGLDALGVSKIVRYIAVALIFALFGAAVWFRRVTRGAGR